MIRHYSTLAFVIPLAACGGNSEPIVPTIDGPDRPDGSTATGSGTILLEQVSLFGAPLTIAAGTFRDGHPTFASERTDGPCVIQRGNSPPSPTLNAGTITITDTTNSLTLAPDAQNRYFASQQGLLFADGVSLSITATGGTVPSFSTPVTFPSSITVTIPSSGFGTIVDRTGFSVGWTGPGPVLVLLTQHTTGPNTATRIRCLYNGVTSATLPSTTLSDLVPSMEDSDNVSILIAAVAENVVTTGSFEIDVQLLNAGFATEGFAR